MTDQFKSWKMAVERLFSAHEVDWKKAARIVVEIAGRSTDPTLRQAAVQALPILRNAAQDEGEHHVVAAKRRLGVVLYVLQGLAAPRFGTRRATPKPLTSEERARKLLDLPLDKQLGVTEIRRAFRRAAKAVHPDAGGSEDEFLELVAAQDALIRPGSYR
jgi:hypothetical protein